MSKKKLLFFSIFIIIILVFVLTIYNIIYKNNNIYLNNKDEAPNFISIMLEETVGSGEYKVSKSNKWPSKGYVFNKEMSYCNNGSTLTWNKNDNSVSVNINKTDKCQVYFDIYVPTIAEYCTSGTDLATCVKNFGDQGSAVSNIYIHNSSLANGAGDNSYRYAGASESVNNFVCFGSTTSPCPEDNLYRIIGVIDGKVKLIKFDYATSVLLGTNGDYKGLDTPNSTYYKGGLTSVNTYYWNYKASNNPNNTWSTSLLNKINLNTNYLNNIGTTWSNMIEDATWKVSGHSTGYLTASEMYKVEITNATKTYDAKIGLMYVSDYGFATSPSAWATTLDNYDGNDANGTLITTINWMYMGYYEWAMTPYTSKSITVFYLDNKGSVYYTERETSSSGFGTRPVLYLKASALYAGGFGTKNSPITLVV